MAALKQTVLFIEDEIATVDLVRRLLLESRFLLESANDLTAALLRLGKPGIALVLLEWRLPGSAGAESVVRIRARAPEVPIIVVAGREDGETLAGALRKGACDFILKKFLSRDVLSRTIARQLPD